MSQTSFLEDKPGGSLGKYPHYCFAGVFLLLFVSLNQPAFSQRSFDVGGLAYFDYYYHFASPDEDLEGQNGFTYRRLYLTTDFRISDAFRARARIEANNEVLLDRRPSPFIKDLYLRWSSDAGHRLTLGLTPPPSFEVSEEIWGYRSLEKTIMDLFQVVSARDMGIRADGPLLSEDRLGYGVMVGNNNSVRPEEDEHKRVYGQFRFSPIKQIVGTTGVDFADYGDDRDYGLTWNGFISIVNSTFRFGVEGFVNRITWTNDVEDDRTGISTFAIVALTDQWEVIGRFDRLWDEDEGPDLSTNLHIFGFSYEPHPRVRLIPNVEIFKRDVEDEGDASARFTVEMNF